jgi:uncharacterized membrane protein
MNLFFHLAASHAESFFQALKDRLISVLGNPVFIPFLIFGFFVLLAFIVGFGVLGTLPFAVVAVVLCLPYADHLKWILGLVVIPIAYRFIERIRNGG